MDDELDSLWRGMKRRHWIIILVLAVALALATLLWLDVRGAGDPQLCGVVYETSDSVVASTRN
jgi:hypothetical protein